MSYGRHYSPPPPYEEPIQIHIHRPVRLDPWPTELPVHLPHPGLFDPGTGEARHSTHEMAAPSVETLSAMLFVLGALTVLAVFAAGHVLCLLCILVMLRDIRVLLLH